jgi:hypothetical protein
MCYLLLPLASYVARQVHVLCPLAPGNTEATTRHASPRVRHVYVNASDNRWVLIESLQQGDHCCTSYSSDIVLTGSVMRNQCSAGGRSARTHRIACQPDFNRIVAVIGGIGDPTVLSIGCTRFECSIDRPVVRHTLNPCFNKHIVDTYTRQLHGWDSHMLGGALPFSLLRFLSTSHAPHPPHTAFVT